MPEKSRQQHDYWDRNLDAANLGGDTSESPESLVRELTFAAVPDIEHMLAALDAGPGKRILDVGTGLGANAVLVANKGATVIALDISHERLATMRKRTAVVAARSPGKILAVKASAEALPFRDNALDGACSRAVLIHTSIEAASGEIARVLRSDAPVAFSEPMARNPFVRLYRLVLAPKEWRGITTYFTQREIAMVQRHFTSTHAHKFYIVAFLAFIFQYALSSPRWFYTTLSKFLAFDALLLRMWRGADRYAWFVVITGRKP